jgi:hypothetical protein
MAPPRTYRTRLPIRAAVAAAAVFWAVIFAVFARARVGEPRLAVGAAVLAAFFFAAWLFYGRTAITLTGDGFVASTPFRRRPVPFEDILQIVVRDGPAGRVYAVVTRRGHYYFTSLFARHRELFETLVERAELRPKYA